MGERAHLEYPVNLHDAPEVLLELINATATQFGLPGIYVEKDYWVTLALKRLSESSLNTDIVFKGGTSLSKAHRIIQRFSEDIDLAATALDLGDSRRKKLMKETEATLVADLTYQPDHPLESKGSRIRKTAHAFPTQSDTAALGQVSNVILLEINTFADPTPAEWMPICTMIHDLLVETDRADLIDTYHLEPFEVQVLSVERTLCEKIMGLVRTSYDQNAHNQFRARIRHFYDIAMILRDQRYQDFLALDEFLLLIDAVRECDRLTMPGSEVWLEPNILDAMIFSDTETLWDAIKSEFNGTFRDMVYGTDLPKNQEILARLNQIGDALKG